MACSRSAIAAFVLALASAGCASGGRYDLEVTFTGGVDSADARFIDVLLVDACPDSPSVMSGALPDAGVRARTGIARGESSLRGLDPITPGLQGLYVRALDASCNVIAAACVMVTLRGGGSDTLAIELAPTASLSACDAASCTDGRCGGPIDAGIDAPMGTCDPPCMPGEYCSAASTCLACDIVASCTGGLSCTGPGTSQCTSCMGGTTLVDNTPPVADLCVPVCPVNDAMAIGAGERHSCAIRSNGQLWCWGNNGTGQLGQDNSNAYVDPVRVGGESDWEQLSVGWNHTCGIRNAGLLFCWGADGNGQLGHSSSNNAPGQVTGSGWTRVSAGARHTCGGRAICQTSNVECWGANNAGQLGNGNNDDQQGPATVSGSLGLCAFAAGGTGSTGHSVFNQNLSFYYTGALFGQTTRNTPGLYGVSATWTNTDQLTAGGAHVCVLHAGELHCAGANGSGQLGTGDTTPVAAPTRIGTASDWTKISAGDLHTCGIRGGNLYCWGENDTHQAGNAATSDFTTPVQLGADGGWTDVSAGVDHTCAIRAGTIHCWGSNLQGQLGTMLPAPTSPTIPVCLP